MPPSQSPLYASLEAAFSAFSTSVVRVSALTRRRQPYGGSDSLAAIPLRLVFHIWLRHCLILSSYCKRLGQCIVAHTRFFYVMCAGFGVRGGKTHVSTVCVSITSYKNLSASYRHYFLAHSSHIISLHSHSLLVGRSDIYHSLQPVSTSTNHLVHPFIQSFIL